MALKWDDQLSVGVDWIDKQHQDLFSRINKLTDGMGKGQGEEEILDLIKFLRQYTIEHFGNEEKVMQRHGYDRYQQHKTKHEKFVDQLDSLDKRVKEEGVSLPLTLKVQEWMNSWWINHIKKTDMLLGKHLTKS